MAIGVSAAYLLAGVPTIAYKLSTLNFRRKPPWDRLEEVFKSVRELNVNDKTPMLIKKTKNSAGWNLIYSVPAGKSVTNYMDHKELMEFTTNSTIDITSASGLMFMNISMRPMPKKIEYEEDQAPRGMLVPIQIGWWRGGLLWHDLSLGHLGNYGMTRYGKSTFYRQMMISLLRLKKVQLFIIDMKKEFDYFKNHAWFTSDYELNEPIRMLEYLKQEIFNRMDTFSKAGCSKIQDYKGKMDYLVLVVDEFSQLCPELSKHNKKLRAKREVAHSLLVDILSMGAAAGVIVCLGMQRPDHKILPGLLRANICASNCYHTATKVNSEVAVENHLAYYLTKRGRALFLHESKLKEVQTPWLDDARAKKILAGIPKKSPKPARGKAKKAV